MAITVKARNTRALAFSKVKGDYSNFYNGESSTTATSSTWVSDFSLSFTPQSSRDFLIVAKCEVNHNNISTFAGVRLNDGTTQYNTASFNINPTTNWRPWQCVLKVTLSGSQTWSIDWNSTTTNTTKVRNMSIAIIDLTTFPNIYYDEYRSQSSVGVPPTDWADSGNILTETTRAGEHILIAGCHCRGATGNPNAHGEVQLLEDGSSLGVMSYQSNASTTDYWTYFCTYKTTLTAASHTYKFQLRKQGSGVGGSPNIVDAAIILLELDPTTIPEVPKNYIIKPTIEHTIINRTRTIDPPYQEPVTVPFTPGAMTFYPSVGMPPRAPDPIIPVDIIAPLDSLWATASPFSAYGFIEHHTQFKPHIGGGHIATRNKYIGTYDPTTSTIAVAKHTIYYIPLLVPIPIYITQLGVYIASLNTNPGDAIIGIYTSEHGKILTLLYSNIMSLNTLGFRFTPGKVTLSPGFYFIAFFTNDNVVTFRKSDVKYSLIPSTYANWPSIFTCYTETLTYGSGLPSSAGNYEGSTADIPRILVRI